MRIAPARLPMRRRLAWMTWSILIGAVVPVSEAQGFWLLAGMVAVASGLGIWLTHRAGRPLLGQRMAAAIALVLGGVTTLVSLDRGTIDIFAIGNWLIAVAVLKCWQLGTSRDYAHTLMLTGLLLLIGSLVSWQLGYAIALGLAVLLGPAVILGWHQMGERERWTRLTGRTVQTEILHGAFNGNGPRFHGISGSATLFCGFVAFVIFALFPRLHTPLQPGVGTQGRKVTGFSAEAKLNDIGRLQMSNRMVMRARLSVGDQPMGGEMFQPYFRGLSYNYYNGRGWERRGGMPLTEISWPINAGLTYFQPGSRIEPPGTVHQEFWIEAGPLPALPALRSPVAISSQEVRRIQWGQDDEVLFTEPGTPAAVYYKILSIPSYLLAKGKTEGTGEPSVPGIYAPVVPSDITAMARALAGEVTDQVESLPPELFESVVGRFMRYLQAGQFTYSLDPPPRIPNKTPLEQFLAVKRGYCEYYATTLAVFCQCLNIPARYVTGFHGGKYNDVGSFYAVRDSEAHSWVEVWLPDRGWTTFDPTPGTSAPGAIWSLRKTLAGVMDYLQFQWSNWVVAYDVLHRQGLGTWKEWMSLAPSPRDPGWTQFIWMFREMLAGPESLGPLGKMLYWLGLLGVVALSGYLIVRGFQQVLRRWELYRHRTAARRSGVRFYERVLSALMQRRLVRQPAETPRQFAERVETALPHMQGCFARLVNHYYAARYGGSRQTRTGEATARMILRRLGRAGTQQEP